LAGLPVSVGSRQGGYARDPQTVGTLPPADVMIERIGDLLSLDLSRLRPAPPREADVNSRNHAVALCYGRILACPGEPPRA